jgi:hypothetical protein
VRAQAGTETAGTEAGRVRVPAIALRADRRRSSCRGATSAVMSMGFMA